MSIRRYEVKITTDAIGYGAGWTPLLRGSLNSIQYVKDGQNPFAAATVLTITDEATNRIVWSEPDVADSMVRAPRQSVQMFDVAIAPQAPTPADAASFAMFGISKSRIKIEVSGAGSFKTGTFHIVINL
jgi:hypothetical protein